MIQLPACALVAPTPPSSPRPAAVAGQPDIRRAAELTRGLARRARGLDSMQTSAVMDYRNPEHHIKARELIVVRRPQDMRIEAMSPFGVALVIAARDSRLEIFRASDNTLMRGAATAATLDRFAQVPLEPQDAVALLLGLGPEPDLLAKDPDAVRLEGDLLVAVYRTSDGGAVELGFLGSDLALARHRLGDGRVRYEVRYSDFRDIGGLSMAYQLDADFPIARCRVEFRYQRPIVDGAPADSTFVLSPGPTTREVDLDQQTISSAALADKRHR